MKTRVLVLGCLLALASQVQSATRTEIWEWTDANGVKHYSDNPAPGARKMVLVSEPAESSDPPSVPAASAADSKPVAPPQTEYERLEILSPQNEASFFGSDTVIQVRVQSEPQVTEPDHLLTFLDGEQVGAANVYEHTLTDLSRGAHQLVSVIGDPRGNEKIRSKPLVFYIKQADTIANPQVVGPALKPQPQPPAATPPRPQPKAP